MENIFLGKSEFVEEGVNPLVILCLKVVPEDIIDFEMRLNDSLKKVEGYKNMTIYGGGICKCSIKVYFEFTYNNLEGSIKDCENSEILFNMNKFEECCISVLKEVKISN